MFKIPGEPKIKLPINIITELTLEDLRVTGIENVLRNLWIQIKQKN
jgi:hypothetical protein